MPRPVTNTREREDGTIERRCNVCTDWLPLDVFANNSWMPFGKAYVCRPCDAERVKRIRAERSLRRAYLREAKAEVAIAKEEIARRRG